PQARPPPARCVPPSSPRTPAPGRVRRDGRAMGRELEIQPPRLHGFLHAEGHLQPVRTGPLRPSPRGLAAPQEAPPGTAAQEGSAALETAGGRRTGEADAEAPVARDVGEDLRGQGRREKEALMTAR